MADGIYQSVMSFFIPFIFCILTPAASGNGLDVQERTRLGCYIAHPAVLTINMYILMNTYRWDWVMLLVVFLSDIFIFFWTGIYTATSYSGQFYQAAPQVYAEFTFWMAFIITPTICLLPRLVTKCIQKQMFPYDVDIIRERISTGEYKAIEVPVVAPVEDEALKGTSSGSSESSSSRAKSKSSKHSKHTHYASVDEDRRPIYPPSVNTHHTRAQNGSDGTNYTRHSLDTNQIEDEPPMGGGRPSIDRARPSYDRLRRSMDRERIRQSLEQSNDFTSAARLSRIESTHSAQNLPTPGAQRRFNLSTVRKRGLSVFSKQSEDEVPHPGVEDEDKRDERRDSQQ